jgi:hypothetical protein
MFKAIVRLDIGKTFFIIIAMNMQFFLPVGTFCGETCRRDHLEDLDKGEDNITMDIQGIGWGCGLY